MRVRVVASVTVAVLLFGLQLTNAQPVGSAQKSPGEKALIYVYRETSIIGIANFDVSFLHVDGRRATRISMGGYIPITVSPGQHKLITAQSLLGSVGLMDGGCGLRRRVMRALWAVHPKPLRHDSPVAAGAVRSAISVPCAS